jgi:hypothetical protein
MHRTAGHPQDVCAGHSGLIRLAGELYAGGCRVVAATAGGVSIVRVAAVTAGGVSIVRDEAAPSASKRRALVNT